MDIGKEGAPYTIEPLEDPVPGREREIVPEPEYAPTPEPVREPVPA